nr:hypothetical protein [Tanacetum cinerariifolium]
MMKGPDIGIQKKKAKLFNEWDSEKEVDELKAERIAKTQDPLALMANSNNPYAFPAPHQDQSSFNQNYSQQSMPKPEDITDPTTAMNMALTLMAKAFKLNYSTPTNNNQRISSNTRNMQIAQPWMNMGQDRQMQMVGGYGGNQFRHSSERNASGQNGNQIRCYNCRGVADLDEIEEVNANCILMANLQQASTSGTQTDSALVYDTDGSAEIHHEKRIKELNNIVLKTGQSIQTIHMLSPKPNSFYHTEQKMALGYQNLFYLKQAQKKQQSLYDGKILLEKHDPPVVHDSEETLQLAQERVFVPQKALLREGLYFSNNSKTANVSKLFLIPNEDLSDDTTPSLARKFLNEVKSTIVTLQRVVKQRMTIETHNWAKIVRDENFPIVNQVDARLQNFEIQFLKEAAKFVGDFKSLANKADASLAKHKALELEIERLLKAVLSQDIMIIVQNESVIDTLDLQTELERTKERFENCIIKKETEYAKLWNDWYRKCDECQYDKISYDKAYKDMQQKIERLQAQLGYLKGVDNNKTRRPQSRSNTKNDRVLSASKSSRSHNKEAEVEEHHRNLLLSKNNKHISSACNDIKIDSQDVISKVVCAMCKKCLISVNHDKYLSKNVNGKNSCRKNQKAKVSVKEIQKKYQPKVAKPKKKFMGTARFEIDHVAAILGFGQFCDSDLEVALRRNACFVRNLEGVDLLKGDRSINLYTINLHEMASASPICLMARASSTKSWLWHQRLSHLNFDTINDLAFGDCGRLLSLHV